MSDAILHELMGAGRVVAAHRPWPRVEVDRAVWQLAAAHLKDGKLTCFGLWAESQEPPHVHLALLAETTHQVVVLTLACPDGRFPSIGAVHPPALRLERAIQDLHGLTAEGLPDSRPWLDHGRWTVRHPMKPTASAAQPLLPYAFLPATGDGLHQIPVGPVHAGIIEPGHFRFTANGETVVRLEPRLGYVHRGLESLMQGAEVGHGAKLAGRASGDSTVAYAIAFCKAAEAAAGIVVPPRALWLRALAAEIERIANHCGDIGAICNDASFTLLFMEFGVVRERVLRAARACFGHRLMMDFVVPGGVAADPSADSLIDLRSLRAYVAKQLKNLTQIYDTTASLQDRTVGTGIVSTELVHQYGAGGVVGRASGRTFDARRLPLQAPYDHLQFAVPVLKAGDVNARVWVRIQEVEQSLNLLDQLLGDLPDGPVCADANFSGMSGQGIGVVEGFRGDVLAWLRLDHGRIARCHLRDPSWFQWPLLEAAIEGNIVADFPLCNKSFNCSYAGHDL
ncbi:MAG: hydrogenase expression protein HypE [Rhodospirillaceae bacterium]|nr:MAG: hydrogenase expression protein HypE [Rhodospirillaceae bacterium]